MNFRTPKSGKYSFTKLYVATISAEILYLGAMFYAHTLVLTFIILHYIQKANIVLILYSLRHLLFVLLNITLNVTLRSLIEYDAEFYFA